MPADDECRDDRLIPTGGSAEEIDDRKLPLQGISEPAVIRRVRIGAHKGVFNDIITGIDLAMSLALIVIPNPPTPPGEHGSDGQQVFHLARFENPALRVDERNPVAAELEAAREISGIENSISQGRESIDVPKRCLAQLEIVAVCVHLIRAATVF